MRPPGSATTGGKREVAGEGQGAREQQSSGGRSSATGEEAHKRGGIRAVKGGQRWATRTICGGENKLLIKAFCLGNSFPNLIPPQMLRRLALLAPAVRRLVFQPQPYRSFSAQLSSVSALGAQAPPCPPASSAPLTSLLHLPPRSAALPPPSTAPMTLPTALTCPLTLPLRTTRL